MLGFSHIYTPSIQCHPRVSRKKLQSGVSIKMIQDSSALRALYLVKPYQKSPLSKNDDVTVECALRSDKARFTDKGI